jgi:hypothetical protein
MYYAFYLDLALQILVSGKHLSPPTLSSLDAEVTEETDQEQTAKRDSNGNPDDNAPRQTLRGYTSDLRRLREHTVAFGFAFLYIIWCGEKKGSVKHIVYEWGEGIDAVFEKSSYHRSQ